jgi:hypothetical protein
VKDVKSHTIYTLYLRDAAWWSIYNYKRFPSEETGLNTDCFMHYKNTRYPSNHIKVNVKLFLCLTKRYTMKTYWGSGGIAPRILDLGTRWRWVVSFTFQPLCPQGKSLCYPLDRRLSGPQNHSGRGGEEKNSLPPTGKSLQFPHNYKKKTGAIQVF